MYKKEFRVYDTLLKEVGYQFEKHVCAEDGTEFIMVGFIINAQCINPRIVTLGEALKNERYMVQQFTGALDVDKKKIFEGDDLGIEPTVTGARGLNPGFTFDDLVVPVLWDEEDFLWSYDVTNHLRFSDYYEENDAYAYVSFRNHVRRLMFNGESAKVVGFMGVLHGV